MRKAPLAAAIAALSLCFLIPSSCATPRERVEALLEPTLQMKIEHEAVVAGFRELLGIVRPAMEDETFQAWSDELGAHDDAFGDAFQSQVQALAQMAQEDPATLVERWADAGDAVADAVSRWRAIASREGR